MELFISTADKSRKDKRLMDSGGKSMSLESEISETAVQISPCGFVSVLTSGGESKERKQSVQTRTGPDCH